MFSLIGKRIILYGYYALFHRTEEILNHIREAGMDVLAVVDRNAMNLPIDAITYECLKRNMSDKKDEYAFILNFSDANMHVKVADELYQDGFENIIFLPFDEKYSNANMQIIRRYFNQILYGKVSGKERLPSYGELIGKDKDDVIKDYGDYVSFWVSVTKLHCAKISAERDVDLKYRFSDYSGATIGEIKFYSELWDYFYNNGKYPKGYVVNSAMGRDEKVFLNNRKELFERMEMKLKYDWNYFLDSPILVSWNNDKGYFTVLDGLHRAVFLMKKGFEKVPVICKKEHWGGGWNVGGDGVF